MMDFADTFKTIYSEFSDTDNTLINSLYERILILYPIVNEIDDVRRKEIVASMVVAHYLVVEQPVTSASGASTGSGLMLSSASVGDVSVSAMSAPIQDMFQYFFGSSKYGLEFLAYLQTRGGLRYVN